MFKCPICSFEGEKFLSQGLVERKNAKCPNCKSLERHRMCYLYFKKILFKEKDSKKRLKFLHFAPMKCLVSSLKFYNLEYLSVDLNPEKAMKVEDINNLSFKDDSFDIIFCSHVLEHIEDDRRAMHEIFRVLKNEGLALILVPIQSKRNKTFEDLTIRTPEERLRVFGDREHLRLYGNDFKERLEGIGFRVSVIKPEDFLTIEEIEKYALAQNSIYLCRKNSFEFLVQRIKSIKKLIV